MKVRTVNYSDNFGSWTESYIDVFGVFEAETYKIYGATKPVCFCLTELQALRTANKVNGLCDDSLTVIVKPWSITWNEAKRLNIKGLDSIL